MTESPGSNTPSKLPSRSGIWLVLAAALLWSTSGFFAKAPLLEVWAPEVRGGILAFWRALFALLFLIPMVRRPRWTWKLIPMVVCFSAMNWTYLTALVGGPPANAIWLQNIAPAYVMLVGVFLLGDKAILRDWFMISCCAAGIGLILTMQLAYGGKPSANWALWLGMLSGMLYAGVILSLRWLRHEDSAWLIALNHLVTAIVMAPFALKPGLLPGGSLLLLLAAFGMMQMGLPYFLFAKGLKSTPSHIASVIALLEPILLPVWIWVAWRNSPGYEPVPWWTMVGAGLILSGMLIRFVPWPGTVLPKTE